MLRDLAVDVGAQPDGLFAGADLGLAPVRLGLTAGVLDQRPPLLFGRTEAGLAEHPDRDCNPRSSEDEADQYPDGDQHGQLLGRLSAALPRCLSRRSAGTGCPESVERADGAARGAVAQIPAV